MTRHREDSKVSIRPAAAAPAPDTTATAAGLGLTVADRCLTASLTASQQAAQDAAGWLDHLQQLGAQAASAWFEALTAAALEFDHAEAPDQWLAVPARLVERQWTLALQCQADLMDRLVQAQAHWPDPDREPGKAVDRPLANATGA